MDKNDMVEVKATKRKGKIIDIQKSMNKRNIYIVEFNEYNSEGYFEEELKTI